MAILILVHLLSVVVWVGGMFFAYMVLRPSAAEVLQPPERFKLWDNVFSRFLKWVWGASISIMVSGIVMIFQFGGMANVPRYIHVMLLLGIVMFAIFTYLYFGKYVVFNKAVSANDWPKAATILAAIRKLVATNLLTGLSIIILVALAR